MSRLVHFTVSLGLRLASIAALALGVFLKDAAAAPVTITIANQGDAATLDGHMRNETTTQMIQLHVYDRLVVFDADVKLRPALATSWTRKDPTTWVFTLRSGVRFHNGEPFDASVAVWNLKRAKTHPNSQFKAYANLVAEARAIDPTTLEIKTPGPAPDLLTNLVQIMMLPPKYVEEKGDAHVARNPVGTGPYKFVEWVKDDRIVLEANPDYWGGKPAIDRVIFRPIPEDATRAAALVTGEVDVVWGVAVQDVPRIEAQPDLQILRSPTQRVIYLSFDMHRKTDSPGVGPGPNPFADVRVRRAIYHALDIDGIIKAVMGGSGAKATQFVTPPIFGYNPDVKPLPHDPARAKALLAEAGYPNGFAARLDCPNDRYVNDAALCEAVAGQLGKVGLRITPNAVPKAVFFPQIDRFETSFYLAGWGTLDTGATLQAVVQTNDPKKGTGRINRGRYSNAEVDALIERGRRTLDDKEREALYRSAIELAMREVAWVPLHQQEMILGAKKRFSFKPRFDEYIFAHEIRVAN
ncbi:MAG TPA: ABC transporter substrate-binding protein [Thermodesulfobacteriota bacterium]